MKKIYAVNRNQNDYSIIKSSDNGLHIRYFNNLGEHHSLSGPAIKNLSKDIYDYYINGIPYMYFFARKNIVILRSDIIPNNYMKYVNRNIIKICLKHGIKIIFESNNIDCDNSLYKKIYSRMPKIFNKLLLKGF